MERDRWALGEARAGHEEARMERDARGRSAKILGPPRRAPFRERELPGPAPAAHVRRAAAAASGHAPRSTHYGDSAVVAYRVPEGQDRMADRRPKVTVNGGDFTWRRSSTATSRRRSRCRVRRGARPRGSSSSSPSPSGLAPSPSRMGSRAMPHGRVQASPDGTRFVTLAGLPGPSHFSLLPSNVRLPRDGGPLLSRGARRARPWRPRGALRSAARPPVRRGRGGAARGAAPQPLGGEGGVRGHARGVGHADSGDFNGRGHPALRRGGPHGEDGQGRPPGLGRASRPMGGPAPGVQPHRREERSRPAGSDRLRGGQAQPQTRRGLLRRLPGADHGGDGPALREEPPVHAGG